MRITLGILLIIIAAFAVLFYSGEFQALDNVLQKFNVFKSKLEKMSETAQSLKPMETAVKGMKEKVSAPPPLRSGKSVPKSILTEEGVMKQTNEARKISGLPALAGNKLLNEAASLKIKDMLEKQYFAHVSPIGEGIETVAEKIGYDYIAIGENLALGDFENDKTLVDGWMASPGHRANILNSRFREIGIAVGKGVIEGRFTWLAVQVFGKPLSSCLQPDENLKTALDLENEELEVLQIKLERLRKEIETMNPRKQREEYNQRVEEYNKLVAQYNGLVDQLKNIVTQYNAEVKSFNECATQ